LGNQHLTKQNGRDTPLQKELAGQAFAHKEAPDGPGGISVSAASARLDLCTGEIAKNPWQWH